MRALLTVLTAAMAIGCGGSDKPYLMPVDSPAKPFAAPEADEIVENAGEEDDWGDVADEGDSGDEPAAPETIEKPAESAAPSSAGNQMVVVMARHRARFDSCYRTALAKAPKLAGRVELELQINGAGKVVESRATGLPGVDACVAKVARELTYPRPAKGEPVTVRYPLVFKPGS